MINQSILQVVFRHTQFDAVGLPEDLFEGQNMIRSITVQNCLIPLNIAENVFSIMSASLEMLTINECQLEDFPSGAIKNLTKLKFLSLSNNKLTQIKKMDFESLKSLKNLDLTGNFITNWEKSALSAVNKTLSVLRLGEHNFISNVVLSEIKYLGNLQVLDLGQADGIVDIPSDTFQGMDKLQKLLIPGCSLTNITKNAFNGLFGLRELDLRINLISSIECGSFMQAPQLRKLSLAGNYLNNTEECWWDGLNHLKDLDLGWNEFDIISRDTFKTLGRTLRSLDLRHNEALREIDEDAFRGLGNLQKLNLSESNLNYTNHIFQHLPSLRELDISRSKVQRIEDIVAPGELSTIEKLVLAGNYIEKISPAVLLKFPNLKELDISRNKWICDEDIIPVADAINQLYMQTTTTGRMFSLLNANETLCYKPDGLNTIKITDVDEELLINYHELEEMKTATILPSNDTNILDLINQTAIEEILKQTGLIGEDDSKEEHKLTTSSNLALYDVNFKNDVISELHSGTSTISFVAITVLVIISIVITATVVVHIKRQRREKMKHRPNNLEMHSHK